MSAAPERVRDLVMEHILAGRRAARSLFVVMALVAGSVLLVPEHYFGPAWSGSLKLALATVFLLLGALFALPALRPAEKHPVLVLLRKRPDDIVWIYVSKQTEYGAPISAQLVLGLSSGRRVAVPADLGREQELLRAVESVAPSATLGWEAEHAAAFRRRPASLRRAGLV